MRGGGYGGSDELAAPVGSGQVRRAQRTDGVDARRSAAARLSTLCYPLRVLPLSLDLDRRDARPYFLWSENLSVAELAHRLHGEDEDERLRLLATLLREALDSDVWRFVRPEEVARDLPRIAHRLGRRRAFWEFLIAGWRADGLLPADLGAGETTSACGEAEE